MRWLIYICMVLASAGALLLCMFVDGVIDLVSDRKARRARRLEEIDRNARAYGWAVGRGQPLAEQIESGDDNPFHDPDWRERIEAN